MTIPTSYERLDYGSTDGSQWGGSSADKLGFYGATPVVQRTFVASLMNTTAIASSTDFGATQTACLQEIMNTLIGLGIWATA